MEQVKVFDGTTRNDALEQQINAWLDEKDDEILEITRTMQTASGHTDNHVTITIFYKSTIK